MTRAPIAYVAATNGVAVKANASGEQVGIDVMDYSFLGVGVASPEAHRHSHRTSPTSFTQTQQQAARIVPAPEVQPPLVQKAMSEEIWKTPPQRTPSAHRRGHCAKEQCAGIRGR